MPDASYDQASFLAGEWSPYAQGRIDTPQYKSAMNVCLNTYPTEEGAAVRRPGFKFLFPTRGGANARRFVFAYAENLPYVMEFTDGHLRLSVDDLLVMDGAVTVQDISTATPAVVTVNTATAWTTRDNVQFIVTGGPADTLAPVKNRQFAITFIDTTHFALLDTVTGAPIDGTTLNWNVNTMSASISRILDFPSPYVNGDWYNNKIVQFNKQAIVLNEKYPPWTLSLTVNTDPSGQFNQFTFTESGPPGGGIMPFEDGPYFDAMIGSTVTPDSIGPSITLTFNDKVGPNQNVLLPGDVGRLVRLYSTPLIWDVTHSYSAGDHVLYGSYPNAVTYTAVQATTGNFPDISPEDWSLDPSAAVWAAGIITAVLSLNQATVVLEGNLLYAQDVTTWRLGRFGGQEGWPRGSCFHEDRLWVCLGNSIFSSMVGLPFTFSPTDDLGNVADNNGITYTLESGSQDANDLLWMHSDISGIIAGSVSGEWLIQASALADPLTPTTIQAQRVTKYGCADLVPVKTPLALVFVQKQGKRVMEFLPDVFTGKYLAPNLSERARHMTAAGIEEIAYMETITPIIWVRTTDGQLRGLTYRRKSSFPSEEASIVGWHKHELGSGRSLASMIVVPSAERAVDVLDIVTSDNTPTGHWVERSTKQFDVSDTLLESFHLDEAIVATAMDASDTGLTIYGAYQWAGGTVSAWIGGLDCGDFTVAADGSIFVPFGSDPDGILTNTYLQTLNGQDFGENTTAYLSSVTTTPARSPTGGTIGQYVISPTVLVDLLGMSFPSNVAVFGGDNPALAFEKQILSYNLETRTLNAQANIKDIEWFLSVDLPNNLWEGTNISAFDNTHTYDLNDFVSDAGAVYISLVGSNVGHDPTSGAPWWALLSTYDPGTNYTVGAFVVSPHGDPAVIANQVIWVSLAHPNINHDPQVSPAFWSGPMTLPSVVNLGFQTSVGPDGFIYDQFNGSTRSPIWKIDPITLKAVGEFGDNFGSSISGPLGVTYSGGMCSVACNNITYLVTVSEQYGNLAVVDGTNLKYAGHNIASVGTGLTADVSMCSGRTAIGGAVGDFSQVFTLANSGIIWSTQITNLAGNNANLSSAPGWNATTIYSASESVEYEGRNYVSIVDDNINNEPDISSGQWTRVVAWSSSTTYGGGDAVVFSGLIYISLINSNLNVQPNTDAAKWEVQSDPGISTSQIVTLTPSTIDTTWTTFVRGNIGYDQTDGNLIMYVNTTDSVTNKAYILKLNSVTGAVMWATPIAIISEPPNLQFARISGGSFGFLADDGTTILLDTGDGSTTISFTTTGFITTNTQVYDAVEGRVFAQGDYNSAASGAPTPLSGTPSTFTEGWATFLPGTAFLGSTTSTTVVSTGATMGKVYTSQGQTLRPGLPQDAGAANGPALGKTRRTHMYSALLANAVTGSMSIGTTAANVKTINFKSPGQIPYDHQTFFNGVQWAPLNDTYSFDSMLLWEITRPYPLTVVSLGAFIETQDR